MDEAVLCLTTSIHSIEIKSRESSLRQLNVYTGRSVIGDILLVLAQDRTGSRGLILLFFPLLNNPLVVVAQGRGDAIYRIDVTPIENIG